MVLIENLRKTKFANKLKIKMKLGLGQIDLRDLYQRFEMNKAATTQEHNIKPRLGLHFLAIISKLRDMNALNKIDKMNKNLTQEETDKIMEDKKFYSSKIDNLKIKLTESKIKLDESYKRKFLSKELQKRNSYEIDEMKWVICELLTYSDMINSKVENLKWELNNI